MKTNIVIDISPPIPYLTKYWFFSYGRKCSRPIKLQDSLKCNISGKKSVMKFIFGMQINIKVFHKFIVSFWVCVARHAQITQNKLESLQYLQKNVCDEVDFLSADKYKSFLQVDNITLGVCSQAYPKYPK